VQRLHHQARASEKNKGKGKFGDDEKGSKAIVRRSGSRASTALFELEANVGLGGARGGAKAENESGKQDESGGENEDGGIQSYRRVHQHIRGKHLRDGAAARYGQSDAQRAANKGKDKTLREHLAHNAATRGPEGDAEGDFAGTTCAANEEKIRDVGTGN
jgi:hypothetical protein